MKWCVIDIFYKNVLCICLHTSAFLLVCIITTKTELTDVTFCGESVPYFCVAELQFFMWNIT